MESYQLVASFALLLVLLLISWSLVSFWQRFLENVFYTTLDVDPTNTALALLIAVSITIIYIIILWVIKIFGVIPDIEKRFLGVAHEDEHGHYNSAFIGETSPRGSLTQILSPAQRNP